MRKVYFAPDLVAEPPENQRAKWPNSKTRGEDQQQQNERERRVHTGRNLVVRIA